MFVSDICIRYLYQMFVSDVCIECIVMYCNGFGAPDPVRELQIQPGSSEPQDLELQIQSGSSKSSPGAPNPKIWSSRSSPGAANPARELRIPNPSTLDGKSNEKSLVFNGFVWDTQKNLKFLNVQVGMFNNKTETQPGRNTGPSRT